MTEVSSPNIVELGLACCAVEASAVNLLERSILDLSPEEHSVLARHILVIAGTVTSALATTVQENYAKLSQPRVVVAFGACAISGGPYWDSYSVLPGAETLIPVDIFVPGCPPAPEDLAAALRQAINRVTA
ncbi:MAG: hypothetical protein KGQ38_07330 [Actinomycetales bacterium]|nr:hypothetical protein [Actinomycetales bacterium]